jgi:hypothetical protein
VYVAEMVWPK